MNSILLVNEDPAVRRMIFRVLTGENYNVITAGSDLNSSPATIARDSVHVDLVLLDLDSEDDQSWSVLEGLISSSTCPPTIVMTDRIDRLTTRNRGISAIMEKPLDVPKLLRTIHDLLDGVAARNDHPESAHFNPAPNQA